MVAGEGVHREQPPIVRSKKLEAHRPSACNTLLATEDQSNRRTETGQKAGGKPRLFRPLWPAQTRSSRRLSARSHCLLQAGGRYVINGPKAGAKRRTLMTCAFPGVGACDLQALCPRIHQQLERTPDPVSHHTSTLSGSAHCELQVHDAGALDDPSITSSGTVVSNRES